MTQGVSHRPIKCQSLFSLWSRRGAKVNGSHHGDSPLLKPTGIKIATKPLPGPTNREHRKLIGVKAMSLGTNYSFYCCHSLESASISGLTDVLPKPTKSSKVIQEVSTVALGGLHDDKLCDTLQAMVTTNVETIHRTSLSSRPRTGLATTCITGYG